MAIRGNRVLSGDSGAIKSIGVSSPLLVAQEVKNHIKGIQTISSAAFELGVVIGTLGNQLSGEKYLSPKIAERLVQKYGFNYDYLVRGEGSLFGGCKLVRLQSSSEDVCSDVREYINRFSSLNVCCDALGVTPGTLGNQLNGKRYLSPYVAQRFVDLYGFSFDFLTKGSGQLFSESKQISTPKSSSEVAVKIKDYIKSMGPRSMSDAAKMVGVPLSTLSTWLDGTKYLDSFRSQMLVNAFGMNKEFIMTGKGELFFANSSKIMKVSPPVNLLKKNIGPKI